MQSTDATSFKTDLHSIVHTRMDISWIKKSIPDSELSRRAGITRSRTTVLAVQRAAVRDRSILVRHSTFDTSAVGLAWGWRKGWRSGVGGGGLRGGWLRACPGCWGRWRLV
eukprot:COSAG01_NODE_10691_length_2104_cov_2.161596_1_plen_110_part_10